MNHEITRKAKDPRRITRAAMALLLAFLVAWRLSPVTSRR